MSIGKVFTAIGHFFQHFGGTPAAQKFIHDSEAILKTELGQIAMNVVSQVEKTELTGDQKRSEAFKQILAQATTSGIQTKNSLIGLLIELAVATLHGTLTTA